MIVLRPFIAARAEHFHDAVAIRLQADEPGKFQINKLNRLAAVCAILAAQPSYGAVSARFCEADVNDDTPKAREIRAEIVEFLDDLWPVVLMQQAEKLFEGSR